MYTQMTLNFILNSTIPTYALKRIVARVKTVVINNKRLLDNGKSEAIMF